MKYKDWLNEWLANYVKSCVKIRTYNRYLLIVNLHIAKKLGEYEIDELTPLLLQQFITTLMQSGNNKTGKGLSSNTVNAIISVVQNSLRTAHLLGLSKQYIGDKIKRPKITEKAVECFSLSEQKQIEQAVASSKKDKLFGIILCLAHRRIACVDVR